VCDNGHFGSRCQYKCHCKTVCLYDGNCSGECEDGWFGLQCQYQNVVYFYKMAVSPINAETLFTNNNVCSNINTLNEVSIDWSTTLPFSWMRIKTKNN
ncbi:multiple epidermal growth factor domains protein 6, partial [Biomphalaria glabrata]